MRQKEPEFAELNVAVKVVTFDGDVMAIAYVNETDMSWPLLLDAEQKTYDAYGMGRGHWWDPYLPSSLWKYLKLVFAGERPGKPGKDWSQLGGDVLIDPDGRIQLHYVSEDPHDRPSVESILESVRAGQD